MKRSVCKNTVDMNLTYSKLRKYCLDLVNGEPMMGILTKFSRIHIVEQIDHAEEKSIEQWKRWSQLSLEKF